MKRAIIGGAGFIGINLAQYYLEKGESITIFDNFSRRGTTDNVNWIKSKYPRVSILQGDIRIDQEKLKHLMETHDIIYHLAGQVAVTTSVTNPREDFEINALGTFNVLEAARSVSKPPILFYSSTNKVYGGMEDINIVEYKDRYDYENLPLGIPENRLLDFHSPYGCSKGAADQYVHDYARIYGLKTVVFRQSCIYGERQFGVEDQGWVAWFIIAAQLEKKISIYGNGKQVRDVLYIKDLIKAYDMAGKKISVTAGNIYNIGGGKKYCLSLLSLLVYLEKLLGKKINFTFAKWRPGDQPVYISDISKAKKEIGWEPKISPQIGVKRLQKWVSKNKEIFRDL